MIDPKACAAKTERGVLLKASDFNCSETFHLNPSSGVLTIATQLDREVVEKVQMGLIVEDTASETGKQLATSKYSQFSLIF